MTKPSKLPDPWDAEALRTGINGYGPYTGANIEVMHVAEDASEVRVSMPLTEANANLVGTQFGGSLYSMVDPHLLILLMQRLGPGYVVWDKSATIDFLRPGTTTVHATIRVTEPELATIRERTAEGKPYLPEWTLEVLDDEDKPIARIKKTLWVRRTEPAAPHVA